MKIEGNCFLLVEDEPIIGFALEDMIEGQGARTAFASTEDMALRLLEEQEFDGAILDVNLHGKHSYEVARKIIDRGIALVFATGYGDSAHPAEFDGVTTIAKPYDLAAITAAFAQA